MIKGIYNENEFYTNFYWESKLLEDLRVKACSDVTAEAAIAALKGLDTQFWSLKEMPEGDPKRVETLVSFYKRVFHALGYSGETREHQTSSGQHLSLFLDVRRANTPDLFAFLLDKAESGTFENSPVFLGAQQESEPEADGRELSEILQEELQDSQNPPRWIFVGAPNALFIVERNKWAFGRYLRIEWQEIFLQRDVKPYELLYGIAAKRVLCPESGSSTHDELDENSHRHAYEVTTELRESVREAIELLINEMIDQRKEGHQKIYSAERADDYARELTHDALYYVYRLLFLLYLEAQGDDSELLPLKSEIYRNGYSLEKLLELDYIDIAPNSAESKGYFLFESLEQIFNLIYFGFEPTKEGIFKADVALSGFLLKGIKSDLFDPSVIKHLKGTKLRNGVLLDILKRLSLTRKKERGGKPRARVSYANLGINQLGAVYEGLLSYTGFFAEEDLHALKPASVKQADIDSGKELDQVYLAPKSLVEKYRKASEKKYKIKDDNIVFDDSGNPKIYKKGSFIYRLAGRDRQKLASFYTPESLTKCTVRYALKVLLEKKKSLNDLWAIRVLEPAMGSGAFLNEAVNQLSERILELEVQQNIGDLKTPKAKQKRRWEIKYRLISENVYGVDLNPTATELARFSLWLNCIGAGKEPPSFEGRLKVGNSLVGARFRKGADGIFPWLLLDEGMLNYGKKFSEYDKAGYAALQSHREKLILSRLNTSSDKIRGLQKRAEELQEALVCAGDSEQRNAAHRQLKLCGDLWCAMFFASPDDLAVIPKTHDELCAAYAALLENGSFSAPLKRFVEEKFNTERFFHWEVEFGSIVSNGGFDLILGNPPWVAVEWQDALYVSDTNVTPAVLDLNAAETRKFIEQLADKSVDMALSKEFVRVSGYSRILETEHYRDLASLSKNTYKAFDILSFSLVSKDGVIGLIQEDGILEEKNGEKLRANLYRRYRYHFQFFNEKYLFAEVNHRQKFSVNVFGPHLDSANFWHIGNLFLVSTIEQCFGESQSGTEIPLIKDGSGAWNTLGHPERAIQVNDDMLATFSMLESKEGTKSGPVFLNLHSRPLAGLVEKFANTKKSFDDYLGSENSIGSVMFDETKAQDLGLVKIEPGRPKAIEHLVMTAPMVSSCNPLYQEASSEYKNKSSYDLVDLEKAGDDFIPRSLFQLNAPIDKIEEQLPKFFGKKYSETYRIVSRGMINSANERSLFTCLIPPGVIHLNGLRSFTTRDLIKLCEVGGLASTLIYDSICRLKNKINFYYDDFREFPFGERIEFLPSIARRFLALNCITSHYSGVWTACASLEKDDGLVEGRKITGLDKKWSSKNILKGPAERLQAQIEMDALASLFLGLSSVEMVQAYETFFPVLMNYDRKDGIDRSKRLNKAYRHFLERGW